MGLQDCAISDAELTLRLVFATHKYVTMTFKEELVDGIAKVDC